MLLSIASVTWLRPLLDATKLLLNGGTVRAIERYKGMSEAGLKGFGLPYKGLGKVGLAQRSVKVGFTRAWRALDPAQQALLRSAGGYAGVGAGGVAVGTQI